MSFMDILESFVKTKHNKKNVEQTNSTLFIRLASLTKEQGYPVNVLEALSKRSCQNIGNGASR